MLLSLLIMRFVSEEETTQRKRGKKSKGEIIPHTKKENFNVGGKK